MNAHLHSLTFPPEAECEPILEAAAHALFAEIRSSAARLEDAKAEALRLITADVASGALSSADAERIIREHRLRQEPYRVPVDVPYTAAFERDLVGQIGFWDKHVIRENLRIGSITRSQAEGFFVRLGFDAAAV